jgi:hypothetical protein
MTFFVRRLPLWGLKPPLQRYICLQKGAQATLVGTASLLLAMLEPSRRASHQSLLQRSDQGLPPIQACLGSRKLPARQKVADERRKQRRVSTEDSTGGINNGHGTPALA